MKITKSKIYVNYHHFDGGKDSLLVYNSYKLRCIQPKFQAVGYDFQKPIAIGDTSAYGNIIIENRNSEVPLTVHHIKNDNPAVLKCLFCNFFSGQLVHLFLYFHLNIFHQFLFFKLY